ncbi:hypothetical protein SLA2020_285660 [Shorea laevis]
MLQCSLDSIAALRIHKAYSIAAQWKHAITSCLENQELSKPNTIQVFLVIAFSLFISFSDMATGSMVTIPTTEVMQ